LIPGLTIKSARQFTAMRFSLPAGLIKKFGPGRVSLAVAPGGALIPVARPGDPQPITQCEIADISAAAHALAGTGFAAQANDAGAAVHLNQLVNALPEARPPTEHERARLLQSAKSSAASLPLATKSRVMSAAQDCAGDFNQYMINGLRACLARHHDDAMVDLTRRTWKKLAPGS
jgi:hypothetical protein